MAWSENNLNTNWITPIRIPNGSSITLRTVQQLIQEQCDLRGIPIAFNEGQLKVGSILNRKMETILNMFHPQQHNYLHFVIRLQHTGTYAFLHVYNMGGSRNYEIANSADDGSTFAKIKMGIFGGNSKLNAEENYYAILKDCLNSIFE